jgi:hypothetical protein
MFVPFFVSYQARAQTVPVNWKMGVATQTYDISSNVPTACRARIQEAAGRWNGYSKFALTYGTVKTNATIGSSSTANVLFSMEPGSNMGAYSANSAQTIPWGYSPVQAFASPYSNSAGSMNLQILKDADIRLNADIWAAGSYLCTISASSPLAANKLDYGRTFAHELGHVVGLDHHGTNNNNCLLYGTTLYAIPAHAPCAAEVTVVKGLYP